MTTEEAKKNITSLTAGDSELTNLYSYLQSIGKSDIEIITTLSGLSSLKDWMKENIVQFTYKKKDGSTRIAFGTRASDVLSQNNDTPQGHRKSSTTFPYYDIEKKAWRCFKPELFIEMNSNYTL